MIHIICGPTAAGKSAIAMELAARYGLTIISADSRQIYRGFDVGTAKPTAAERGRVRHTGLDVADPGERWSAARWAQDAHRCIDASGPDRVLVVGGTGLYLRALVQPLFTEPVLDPERRAQLAAEIESWPVDRLREWVRHLDPDRAHLGRTQLLRAIEVALLTGRRLSALHREGETQPRHSVRWLVVDPAADLHTQIALRLDAMIAGGWLDEVRRLAVHVEEGAPAWQACGYAAMRDVVREQRTLADARTDILVHTRQYAKRQRTWFRHQLSGNVMRLDPRASGADASVRRWWGRGEAG